MNPHLFVYGTLLSGAGHPMGARLRREARLLGEGSVQGRLYRVSWYPALVATHDDDARVHGEVYELNNPAATLNWLDSYEGISRTSSELNAYRRAECAVRLAAAAEMLAWVYLYQRPVRGLQLILDGRWRPRRH